MTDSKPENMEEPVQKHGTETLKRWIWVLVYAVIGALVVWVGSLVCAKAIHWIDSWLGLVEAQLWVMTVTIYKWSLHLVDPAYPWVRALNSAILNVLDYLQHMFHRGDGLRCVLLSVLALVGVWIYFPQRRIGKQFRYPPLWVSVLLGAFIYASLHEMSWVTGRFYFLVIDALWLVVWLGACVREKREKSQVKNEESGTKKNLSDLSREELIKWIESETPVETVNDDWFEYHHIARNIADTIYMEKRPTIALLGKKGVGKSSVLNMAKDYLQKTEKGQDRRGRTFVFCRIDAWGRLENDLLEYILAKGIDKLKPYIDVTGLTRIPENYLQAIESVDKVRILSAFMRHKSNKTILRQLDRALIAAGIHLVYFIEDVDRNHGKDDKTLDVILPALLDRFATDTQNVSFVLTCDTNSPHEWVNRTCHYIFSVTPDQRMLRDVVKKYREFRSIGLDFVDPENPQDREQRYCMTDNCAVNVLPGLMKTPRRLKVVMRDVHRIWKKIYGEVDPDVLLIVMTLKYCTPDVFSFVEELLSREDLRQSESLLKYISLKKETVAEVSRKYFGSGSSLEPHYPKEIHLRLIRHLNKDLSYIPENPNLGETLNGPVDYLLDALFVKIGEHIPLQGIAVGKYSDPNTYWARIEKETVELRSGERKDQDLLQLIKRICHSPSGNASQDAVHDELIRYIQTDYGSIHMARFRHSSAVDSDQYVSFALDVVRRHSILEQPDNAIKALVTSRVDFEPVINEAVPQGPACTVSVYRNSVPQDRDHERQLYDHMFLKAFCSEIRDVDAFWTWMQRDSTEDGNIIGLIPGCCISAEMGDGQYTNDIRSLYRELLERTPNLMIPRLINLFIQNCGADWSETNIRIALGYALLSDIEPFKQAIQQYDLSVVEQDEQRKMIETIRQIFRKQDATDKSPFPGDPEGVWENSPGV